MTDPKLEVFVDEDDSEILVTLPGTRFSAVYRRSAHSLELVETSVWAIDDPDMPIPLSEFGKLALAAALDRALELGWVKPHQP